MTFRYKDYRIEGSGRYKTMTVAPGEFIRRFMVHLLPKGFHRIRHYGLLARSRQGRYAGADRAGDAGAATTAADEPRSRTRRHRGDRRPGPSLPVLWLTDVIIEMFEAGSTPRNRPTASTTAVRIDTS